MTAKVARRTSGVLGNHTLVTQSLNSSMSNAAWIATTSGEYSKRAELAKRSVLLLSRRLCQNDRWDEARIDERGAQLTERILRRGGSGR